MIRMELLIKIVARRLVGLHPELRFTDDRGWCFWDADRWYPDPTLLYVSQCVERAMRSVLGDVCRGERRRCRDLLQLEIGALAASPCAMVLIANEASSAPHIHRPAGWIQPTRIRAAA